MKRKTVRVDRDELDRLNNEHTAFKHKAALAEEFEAQRKVLQERLRILQSEACRAAGILQDIGHTTDLMAQEQTNGATMRVALSHVSRRLKEACTALSNSIGTSTGLRA